MNKPSACQRCQGRGSYFTSDEEVTEVVCEFCKGKDNKPSERDEDVFEGAKLPEGRTHRDMKMFSDGFRKGVLSERNRQKALLTKLKEEVEVCICAAIKMPDEYIIRGHRHNDCLRTISGVKRYKNVDFDNLQQGFMTTRNRFVNRNEGYLLQKAAGIKSVDRSGDYRDEELYSEDLY